jgi:uncharacterized protein YjbI with pentapeptide repeats
VCKIGEDLCNANLRFADLSGANLSDANLRGANLCNANLRGADLRDADIDHSSWPLWCGSKDVKVDMKIAAQLAGHGAVVDVDLEGISEDTVQIIKDWQVACKALGKLGHRAWELGLLKD